MNRILFFIFLPCAVLVAVPSMRVIEMPSKMIHEQETAFLRLPGMETVQVSNATVLSALYRNKTELLITGLNAGDGIVTVTDAQGGVRQMNVRVCPLYWEMLIRLFEDDPEINISLVGDRVVLSGATANVEVMRRLKQAVAFDPERIVNQVTYSPEALNVLVHDFLIRSGQESIIAELIGHEVCLSGQMYDAEQIATLKARVEAFLQEFAGVTVSIDGLRVYKQKILIGIEFLSYDTQRAHNLGVEISDTLGAKAELKYVLHDNLTGSVSDAGNLSAQINTLKKNQVAKKLYATTLSTQSGEEAEFQSGGTLYKQTSNLYNSDMKEIEYGYIIKAKPMIVDLNTVNLEFNLDLRTPLSESKTGTGDTDISRYQTKSKYIVRPGESILLSGFNHWTEEEAKTGLPILSRIPWLGALFGSESAGKTSNEMLLVVTINWAIDDSDAIRAKTNLLRDKPVTTPMP
ncbi:MAG: pilus assembly protein N-terminal domain-containing protein [Kiritimatiellia bacterium]